MSSESSSSLRATISATTRGFIYSYLNGNSVLGGPKPINSNLTPDCKHYMLLRSFPKAIESPDPDQPSPSRAAETPSADDPKVCTVQTAVSNLTIDEVARRSAARSIHVIRFVSGQETTVEYVWFFHLIDDGSRIKRIEQFCEEGARKMHDTRQEPIRQVNASGPPSQ